MRQNQDVIGEGIRFERIRRITGYLVGDQDRFNLAKRAEVDDRIKHGLSDTFSNASLGARERPLGAQSAYTRLHDLEEQFGIPDTHRMIYARYNGDLAFKPDFEASDIRKRTNVLEYLEKHHNDMSEAALEFWLDTIRYDGEPDLDKEPSPEKYKSPMKQQLEDASARAEMISREEGQEQERAQQAADLEREVI